MKRILVSSFFRVLGKDCEWYYKNGVDVGDILAAWFFLVFLKRNRTSKYLCAFSSRLTGGEALVLSGEAKSARISLLVSGGCYIAAGNGIEIGEGTIWSHNVVMTTGGHDPYDLARDPTPFPIKIGKRCWLGANAVILPGVTLGDNTVVGANAVVNCSFPEGNIILAGAPARVVKKLD